ncbi:MAG: response regulator, partial [Prolixibacteraceae bacterium]
MKTEIESELDIPNILIVDDIGANLRLLNDILSPEGYKIRQVPNGELALKVAEEEKPDLILLDIMMPYMNGYEVCRRLKENPELKDIPVIFISALGETNDILNAFNSGGVDYINKPIQAEEVKARVRSHIRLQQQSIVLHRQSKVLQRQSKELRDLNATKDKFFSIIAHDLRGPFNGFLGLTQLMAEDLESLSGEDIKELSLSM